MKKVLIIVLAVVLSLTALSACGETEKTATAYGIANNDPCKATVTVKGSDLLSATLEEAQLLTDVTYKIGSIEESDFVAVEVTSWGTTTTVRYYKTVKVGDVTFTFDADQKAYVTGSTTFGAWVKDNVEA